MKFRWPPSLHDEVTVETCHKIDNHFFRVPGQDDRLFMQVADFTWNMWEGPVIYRRQCDFDLAVTIALGVACRRAT